MDAAMLARVLYEEFDGDGWGNVDPHLFKQGGESASAPASLSDDGYALLELLQRAAKRLDEKRSGS